MLSDKKLKIVKNDSKKKIVDVRNIEPVNNIQIIKDHSDSDISSSDISDSDDSDSDSELSEISKYNDKKSNKKGSKNRKSSNTHGKSTSGTSGTSGTSRRFENNKNYDFSAFSNPKKISKNVEPEYSESEYSSIESESDYSGSGDSELSNDNEKARWEEKQRIKQDILMKIQSLESKGFEFSKKFNMNSNYEDMKYEYEKVKHFVETQAAIKFSRRCLMACVTGIEFLNKRFDPFNIKLEGWSENVMESVNDYDNIFERLHEKYSSKGEIAPEIELLLTLGGSAFMFHLTNSLLKGPSLSGMPGMSGTAANNPNFMQNMMGAMNQSMSQMNQVKSTRQMDDLMNQQSGPPKPVETRGIRKEMKGPTIDQSLFAGTHLMSNYPKPPAPIDYQDIGITEDDRFSIASSDSSLSSISLDERPKIKKINVNNKKKGGGGKGGFELDIN